MQRVAMVVPTNQLQLCQEVLSSCLKTENFDLAHETFRVIIACSRKKEIVDGYPCVALLCSNLLEILSENFLFLDSQMLGSIAFCVALAMAEDEQSSQSILRKCLSVSEQYKVLNIIIAKEIIQLAINNPDLFKLCLCHGILQSRSFKEFGNKLADDVQDSKTDFQRNPLSQDMLEVTLYYCTHYSRLTHLAFRVLHMWLVKLLHTNAGMGDTLFYRIFPVVCTNWESPMNGIREQNGKLLDVLITLFGTRLHPLINSLLQHQPWTVKSKYLALAILLPKFGIKKAFVEFPDLPKGLLLSLHQSHLVSAGCETYRACLLDLDESDWSQHFMSPIVGILTGQKKNSIQLPNLFNYWMPYTLQKFPSVGNSLLSLLCPEPSLSVLHLLKQSQTFFELNCQPFNEPSTILHILNLGIRKPEESVRQLSLAITCLSVRTTVVPSAEEFKLVTDFLTENISADSSPFRQNIFTSISAFTKRLYESTLNELKKISNKNGIKLSKSEPVSCGLQRVANFLNWLHTFLVSNLEPGTNYQRKILSLRLYQLVLLTWCRPIAKAKKPAMTLITFLSDREQWHFASKQSRHTLLTCVLSPTEDIREISGAILIEYFCSAGADSFREHCALFDKSLQLCRSAMFYQVEGGALLLKIVGAWMYEVNQIGLLSSSHLAMIGHPSLFSLLMAKAAEQWTAMKENLFDAASQGSPVHGIITAITRIATDSEGPEYSRITQSDVDQALIFMEDLVEHLLLVLASKANDVKAFAPSFAEMGEAIELATQQKDAPVKLTAAHQLVLNCVWLNFKACCLLASGLACKPGTPLASLRRCAHIVVQVLTRCRHKGAIESAGSSLSKLVQAVSATDHRALPAELIGEFLDSHTGGASVTRRSAGLAILVHRIVTGDQQNGKPLVKMVVNRLIVLVGAPIPSEEACVSDLPQAQALHFLRTLLQDASLRQHVAPFISQVAILCFENLNSPIWTIRNAALQLFGAVVTKLVGQKKPHEDEIIATAEELSFHFPQLFAFLLSRLQEAVASPVLHPTLVPVLSLLSKMSIKHPYLLHSPSSQLYVHAEGQSFSILFEFRPYLGQLLASHVLAVRKLAAQAYAGFTPFSDICGLISYLVERLMGAAQPNKLRIGENQLNGILLAVKCLANRLYVDSVCMPVYENQASQVASVLNRLDQLEGVSYFNRSLIAKLTSTSNNSAVSNYARCQKICEVFDGSRGENKGSSSIGIYQWANDELQTVLTHCYDQELFPCLICILLNNESIAETSVDILIQRLIRDDFPLDVRLDTLDSSFGFLFSDNLGFHPSHLMNLILSLQKLNCIMLKFDLEILKQFYEIYVKSASRGEKCAAMGLMLVCSITNNYFKSSSWKLLPGDLEFLKELVETIKTNCDPYTFEEDQRITSAVSLCNLTETVVATNSIPDNKQTLTACLSAVITMLQDENGEVRSEASSFASTLISSLDQRAGCDKCLHPYSCLKELFTPRCLVPLLGRSDAVQFLWGLLNYEDKLVTLADLTAAQQLASPFDHGTRNIYSEGVMVVEWAEKSLRELLDTAEDETSIGFRDNASKGDKQRLVDAKKLLELASLHSDDTPNLYLVAKQISAQQRIAARNETCAPVHEPLQNFIQHLGLIL